VLVAYARMDRSKFRPGPVAGRGKGQVRAGFHYAMSVPELRIPLIMMAIIGTFSFNFSVVIPLLVHETFGGNDTSFTWLFSVISVGSLVGALTMARRQEIGLRHVVTAAGFFGVSMLVFALSPNLAASFPIGIVLGAAGIGFMTASTAIVQMRSDPAMRGRVLALQSMVFLGSTPIGGPILGAVCDWLGPRTGVAIGGVAALAAATWGHYATVRFNAAAPALPTDLADAALVAP